MGNARTYLVAHWSAISRDARMVLRIEDIDSPRVKPWAVQQAIDDLTWLGVRWDEGPDVGGDRAPYIQTRRTDFYDAAIAELRRAGRVYPCTCTRRDIQDAASAPHDDRGRVIYPGTCDDWAEGEPLPDEGSYCWRFRVSDRPIAFDDRVLGFRQCNPRLELGDVPVTRKSGEAAYQLAVVVDDAAMRVTEVVRGNDLVDSTFWQIDLAEALHLAIPEFVHVPLVVGRDGRRLAKRHGDTRLSHLREHNVTAQEVVLWAAQSLGIPVDAEGFRHASLETIHQRIASALDWQTIDPRESVAPDHWTRL